MIRTEPLTRPGSFQFRLGAGVPASVQQKLKDATEERWGYLVNFATWTHAPDLSFADYTGVIAEMTDRGVSGFGLSGLLQTDDSIGLHQQTNRLHDGTAILISDWIDLVLPYAGLTEGTEYGTQNLPVSGFWWMGLGAREIIDHVIDLGQAINTANVLAWRVNPDGTFDYGDAGSGLFKTTPEVIVLNDPSPSRGGGDIRVCRGQINRYSLDSRQVAKNVYAYGGGFGDDMEVATATAGSAVAWGLGGAEISSTYPVNASGTDLADIQDQADEALLRVSVPLETFDVRSDDSTIRLRVEPGDIAYVYDEALNLIGDGSNMTVADGRLVDAKAVRVTTMRTESVAGEGFWLYNSKDDEWTDLTPWVITGQGRSRWEVTTDLGPGGISNLRSPNRLDINTDPNPNPAPPLPDPYIYGGPGTNPGGYEVGVSF